MDASQFFRRMHFAFSCILAADSDPVAMIERLVTQSFDLFEGNVEAEAEGVPDLACCKNCPSCCSLRVTATAPEIFLLAHYVRLIEATPSGAQLNLSERIAETSRATAGLDEQQRMELRRACPLIFKGVCIAHPVRPLACRGHASFDRKACAQAAAGRDVDVPVSELHLGMRALVQSALQSAMRSSDRAWGLYELNHGLELALDASTDRRAAWARGEDSLAPTIPDLDMGAMAQTFDALLNASAAPGA